MESLVGIDSSNELNLSVLRELAEIFSSNTLSEVRKERLVERFLIVRGEKIVHVVFDVVPALISVASHVMFKMCYFTQFSSAYEAQEKYRLAKIFWDGCAKNGLLMKSSLTVSVLNL